MKTLPDKPSELIRLALDDLKKCEKSKKYKIDMWKWHESNGECAVCLAGAVMAQTLKVKRKRDIVPSHFPEDIKNKLMSLNFLRQGYIDLALRELGLNTPSWATPFIVTQYKMDKKQFKQDMRKLADYLEEHNL